MCTDTGCKLKVVSSAIEQFCRSGLEGPVNYLKVQRKHSLRSRHALARSAVEGWPAAVGLHARNNHFAVHMLRARHKELPSLSSHARSVPVRAHKEQSRSVLLLSPLQKALFCFSRLRLLTSSVCIPHRVTDLGHVYIHQVDDGCRDLRMRSQPGETEVKDPCVQASRVPLHGTCRALATPGGTPSCREACGFKPGCESDAYGPQQPSSIGFVQLRSALDFPTHMIVRLVRVSGAQAANGQDLG